MANIPDNGRHIVFVGVSPSYTQPDVVYRVGRSVDRRTNYVGQVSLTNVKDNSMTHVGAYLFDLIGWRWKYVYEDS